VLKPASKAPVIANRNSYIEETDPVRRLVSFIGISLDGYYQGPNAPSRTHR
jgi:hypothetical protein